MELSTFGIYSIVIETCKQYVVKSTGTGRLLVRFLRDSIENSLENEVK